jgi:predicted TPR repeat methyltransferase
MFSDYCERTGRFEEAAKAYEMILYAEPGDVKDQEGLIRCLEALSRYDDAASARDRFGRQEER